MMKRQDVYKRQGEDDPHLKVLQAAHISDDEYFSQMVRDDLNLIIRDIREAHKKDSERDVYKRQPLSSPSVLPFVSPSTSSTDWGEMLLLPPLFVQAALSVFLPAR